MIGELDICGTVRSRLVRNAARMERCTIEVVGVCCHDVATTVLAHLRNLDDCGIGLKPGDDCAVFACVRCHDWLDGRICFPDAEKLRDWYIARALVRTHRRLIRRGVFVVKP